MARKKKSEPEYIACRGITNLVKLSIRYEIPLEELRNLNPGVRNCIAAIPIGKEVRIK